MPSGARRAPGAALRCDSAWAGGGVKPASLWRVRVHQKFMSRPHDCVERFALSDLLSFKNSCRRRHSFAFACVAKWLRQRLYMPGVIGSTPIMGIFARKGSHITGWRYAFPTRRYAFPVRYAFPSGNSLLYPSKGIFRFPKRTRQTAENMPHTQGSPYPPDLVP